MKGTAILFHDDLSVTFFENVDPKTWGKIKEDQKEIHENNAFEVPGESVLWLDEEIDWEYGY